MTGFVQYGTAEAEGERRRQQERADLFKSLEQWQAVFRGKLEQGMRHGLTKAIRESIDDAAAECGSCITRIMESMPAPMLTAPNRYG